MALDEHKAVSEDSQKPWVIETAHWRDYTQLNHLEKACFSSQDVWPFWDLIGVLTLPGLVRLKAVIEGRMAGFISGEREITHQVAWVTSLAVHPSYRRLGIALDLLSRCEKLLDTPVIRLSVRETNQPAVNLYQTNGYREVKRWKKYYVGGEDAIVFEKRR